MYKLVAMDLDNTLLDNEKKISAKSKETIQKVRSRGTKVVIASGRGYEGIKQYLDEVEFDGAITLNGAVAFEADGEKKIFREFLNENLVKDILKMGREENMCTILFTEKDIYSDYLTNDVEYFYKNDGIMPNKVDNLVEFYNGQDVGKILISGSHELLEKFKLNIINKFGNNVNVAYSMPYFLEIYSPNVDKGVALKEVAIFYDINSNEVIAMGDAENDISMLEFAGLGIAMKNASANVKKVSNYITGFNYEDGAANAIDKFIIHETDFALQYIML